MKEKYINNKKIYAIQSLIIITLYIINKLIMTDKIFDETAAANL